MDSVVAKFCSSVLVVSAALASVLSFDVCKAIVVRELVLDGNARMKRLAEVVMPAAPPLLQLPAWVVDVSAMAGFERRKQAHEWRVTSVTDLAHSTSKLEALESGDAEDTHVYEKYFFGRAGGTFLEAGAIDGIRYSVTHALDRDLGWRGVGVVRTLLHGTQPEVPALPPYA
jgi:hypothetical protein